MCRIPKLPVLLVSLEHLSLFLQTQWLRWLWRVLGGALYVVLEALLLLLQQLAVALGERVLARVSELTRVRRRVAEGLLIYFRS